METKAPTELTKQKIIVFIREQKPYLKKEFGVTKIALFGSYARDEQTVESDIDLLIEAKEHKFRNRMRLKRFLEESLGKKVDVSYFGSIRGFIMQQIQEDIIYA